MHIDGNIAFMGMKRAKKLRKSYKFLILTDFDTEKFTASLWKNLWKL